METTNKYEQIVQIKGTDWDLEEDDELSEEEWEDFLLNCDARDLEDLNL